MSYSFTAAPKDPSALLDYEMDWSAWLAEGETIVSSPLPVVSSSAPALTVGTVSVSGGTKVRFRIGGGVAGQNYTVTVRITTSIGQIDERSVLYRVRER